MLFDLVRAERDSNLSVTSLLDLSEVVCEELREALKLLLRDDLGVSHNEPHRVQVARRLRKGAIVDEVLVRVSDELSQLRLEL